MVTDFGLAKSLFSQSDLTKTGSTVGTPSYMSPEQVRGETKTTDQRCDVWALGVILYQLICGDLPFKGESIPKLYEAILQREPINLTIRFKQLKTGLNQIIRCCLEKEPEHRYKSASELSHDLDLWLRDGHVNVSGQSHVSRLARGIKRGKARILVPLLSLLFLFGAGSGIYLWKQHSDSKKPTKATFNVASFRKCPILKKKGALR